MIYMNKISKSKRTRCRKNKNKYTRKKRGSGIRNVIKYYRTPKEIRNEAKKTLQKMKEGEKIMNNLQQSNERISMLDNYRYSNVWDDDSYDYNNIGLRDSEITRNTDELIQIKMKEFIKKYSSYLTDENTNEKCLKLIDSTYLNNFNVKQFVSEEDVHNFFTILNDDMNKCKK